MKIICNGVDLNDAVSKVAKALPMRSVNPILDGIKLHATNGSLIITATDLELSIEKVIVADVIQDGVTVVPGKFFSDLVKKLNNMQVELFAHENKLKISYGVDGKSETPCFSPDSYPEIAKLENAQYFEMQRKELKDLVSKTVFAAGTDDARPVLKSLCLEIGETNVEGVALDGYRVAKCVKPILSASAKFNILVPTRGIQEIARLLDETEDAVKLLVQRNFLMAELDGTTIVTRLLDGGFLNYRNAIPSSFSTVVTLPKTAFSDALSRAELFASADRNYLVKFDIGEDSLKVSAEGINGVGSETIPAHLEGNELTISFNAKYFTDILRSIDGEMVQINLGSSSSPCTITPTNNDNCLYLVLPVKNI